MTEVPTFSAFFEPVVRALLNLGGSGTNEEINAEAIKVLDLPDEVVDEPHVRRRGTAAEQISGRSEVEYRLAWARTYLKQAGYITNSARSVWALTEKAHSGKLPPTAQIIALARAAQSTGEQSLSDVEHIAENPLADGGTTTTPATWQEKLMAQLHSVAPAAFERLAQRTLREAGFVEVKVTGRTGDGGIDGRGIVRLHNVVSLHAIFQCKRYVGSVDAQDLRQFRGAMTGRSDYGIFITTGRYTRGAIEEASRDGAPPIDLIDGERLVAMLKELRLGVNVKLRQVEDVEVDESFFAAL